LSQELIMQTKRINYAKLLLPLLLFLAFWLQSAAVHAAQADLVWDPPANADGTPATVGGYKVHRGTAAGKYSQSLNVGTATSYTDTSLIQGNTYYFAVTAYDASGSESEFSNEIAKGIPATGGGTTGSPVSKTGWRLVYVDSQETKAANRAAVNAFDGNTATLWITDWATTNASHPHEIQIDLGQAYDLDSFSYTPPQDGSVNGRIANYEFYVSDSTSAWGVPVAAGTFGNDADIKQVGFEKKSGRYIRLRALSEANGNPWTSASEIDVTGTPSAPPSPIYTITASTGTGGTITPAGTAAVNGGASQTFAITPAAGYAIAGVSVDGKPVGIVSSYTFSNLTANHTIAASFAAKTYTIAASTSTGGTVSPAGTATVNHGAGQVYTITAASGYEIADVTVNGTSVGRAASYTFSNVIANQTIAARFAPVIAGIAKNSWKLLYTDSEETRGANRAAVNAIDGNSATMWITDWTTTNAPHPHEVQVDLGQSYNLDSFSYLPPQDGSINGRIARYEFYVSDSTGNWGTAVSSGTFANDATRKAIPFTAKKGRYIRLRALSEVNGNPWTSMAELDVTGTPAAGSSASPAIPVNGWKLVYTDSQETRGANRAAVNAFDGNTATMWITDWTTTNAPHPHEVQIDLGQSYNLDSFSYLPPQDGSINGRIARYEFYVSDSTGNWGTAVATGTFVNDATSKKVTFTAKKGRYIRLRALSEANGNPWTSAAEIGVTGTPAAAPASSVIPVSSWKLVYTDSEETRGANRAAVNAFDGNSATMWITDWTTTNAPHPHEVQIDLGQSTNVDSFSCLPPQDGSINGRIARYEFYVSDSTANLGNRRGNRHLRQRRPPEKHTVRCQKGRYIRLRALSEVNGNPWTSAAEIGITGTP